MIVLPECFANKCLAEYFFENAKIKHTRFQGLDRIITDVRKIAKNRIAKEVAILIDRETGKPQERQVEGLTKNFEERGRFNNLIIYAGKIKNTKIFAIVFEPQAEAFLEKIDPELKKNPDKYKREEGCQELIKIISKKPKVLEEVKTMIRRKFLF
jgi:hypothetical protein